METISSIADLKNAIQMLEAEQLDKENQLKAQFNLVFESLKPINILKNTLKEVATAPFLIDNIIGTLAGLGTGYLSKKIVVGGSANIIRKLFGSVLQFGVTNVVSQHPETIKTIGQSIFQFIFHKKDKKLETEVTTN